VLTFLFAWQLSDRDLLGFGAWVGERLGYSILGARESNAWYHYLLAASSVGLLYATGGTNVAHEFVHRTRNSLERGMGWLLLALTADTTFAIEHVHGHHAKVGTFEDPATARRGEGAHAFFWRSTVGGFAGAWRIECKRLERVGKEHWSLSNRVIRGQALTLLLVATFYYAGGVHAVLALLFAMYIGKSHLELVNYIEHYGLIRAPGTAVAPRHSWDCHRSISGALLFNLTRHAHHHAKAHLPYWELEVHESAPKLPYGYLTMIIIAAIPPWWHAIMTPRLRHWDAHFASDLEKKISAGANRKSGLALLQERDGDPGGAELSS
jgi:alkane 1-monooxygenase